VVYLDDIIEYATNTHNLDSGYTTGDNGGTTGGTTGGTDTLLALMTGQSANGNTTPGEICKVLAAKQGSSTAIKGQTAKVKKIQQLQQHSP
jgi:hypothetical protein